MIVVLNEGLPVGHATTVAVCVSGNFVIAACLSDEERAWQGLELLCDISDSCPGRGVPGRSVILIC